MEQNLNQPTLPQIKYQGIQEIDNTPKTTDNIVTLQRDIRKSANSSNEVQGLTADLFSGLDKQSQKPRFESYTPYEGGDLYASTSEGELLSKYENYIPGTDNNERLASQQTTSEKWSNGIIKALAKTGSAILGGTAGIVYGVGSVLNDGSFSSIYDNSFSNTLSDWDTKLQYQLPNLYTKQESEKNLFGQMGTANFWADKFFGGLSFTAGAIVSEGIWAYATGGASLATTGARLGTRIGRWGVESLGEVAALQGLTKYKGLYKTMLEGTIKAGKIGKSFPNALGKAGELTSSIGILARSAGYESSVEALQYKREATENFHQNFAQLNGREPNSEELSEFIANLEDSSNAVFATNMAILMPSNLITMGHILDIKSPIKTGFSAFIDKKAFGYGLEKGLDVSGKVTYKVLEPTLTQKVARTGFNYIVKPALVEGLFEEGLQGVTTKTANKWLEHSYDSKYSNANLDTIGAFYESMGEQYGTKEGWVENGLGMIIGIVGGSVNARSEIAAKTAELGYQASVSETFQTENLQAMLMPNRIQSANRMQGFSEEAKVEAQKGNISKSSLAQKSSLLTYINAKLTVGEDIPDIVREIKMGLDSTTEDQWKDVGISADEIEEHKEETLKDFEDLAKDWKSNKTYWGYMIGSKIEGEQSIDTISGGTKDVIEALAWQSTIGETANKQMKDAQDIISSELGSEYANTVNLNSLLKTQSRDLKQQINIATRNYKIEIARRDSLVQRIAKLNAVPKQPESANKPAGKQVGVLNESLLETEQKIAELDTQLQDYAEQINRTSAYQKEIGTVDLSSQDLNTNIVLGQDLVSLQDNLLKFGRVLEGMQITNPQRATYLNDLLKEYSDSEEVFLQNQATQRVILNPDFKIKQINSWIQNKIKRNVKMNENTQEWLTDTLKTYQKSKIESLSDQADVILQEEIESRRQSIIDKLASIEDPQDPRVIELQEELDNIQDYNTEIVIPEDKGEVKPKSITIDPGVGKLTQVEAYKKRISDALKVRQSHLTYLGDNYDDVANKKPTQVEVDEYIRLRDEKDFDSLEYQQLQQKLSDWKLLDSAVDEDYVSLGDLILGVEQLEQEIEQEDTLDEITPENAPDISDSEGVQATENVTRYDILQNTNGSMTIKRRKDGKFTIHHLKLSTIASRMGVDFTLLDKNGKPILFGEETPGSVLTVEGVEFKVIGGNAIEVKEEDFISLQERLNMYPLNTGKVTWSYSDIYTRIGDDFIKMESDFKDITINSERIYDLTEGDRLVITVNNDGYNDKLYSNYKSAKGEKSKQEALKFLKDNLKLNATTVTGIKDNVSILKALREEIDINFIRLREKAFDAYMSATDKSNVNLGIEVKVDGIFLGSPRFTITDGNIQSNPITERGVKEVISTGYIENGELTLSRELKSVNTTFVGKLSKANTDKKIPVVIFKRGAYNVAYPVTMSKIPNNLSSLFDSIITMRISNQEKVRKLNSEIQFNSIKTNKLSYEDVYNNEKLSDVRKAFESVETFVSAADFANKNYNKNNLIIDARVNIDLENIDSIIADAKLRIRLDDSIKYMTEKELKYESMTELEDELSSKAQELYKDYNKNAQSKYIDPKGEIIEDTGYTNTFDETPIEKPTSQLDKIKNINILRKAFEGLTPKLKKIIGQDTVNKVNEMFKQYDFIKSQITPDKNNVNSGKKNSEC
jgi:hypothetical protein